MQAARDLLNDTAKFDAWCEHQFTLADTDGNGTIEIGEFEASYLSLSQEFGVNPLPTSDQARALFAELDIDHSNAIDRSEFKAYMQRVLNSIAN